MSSFFNEILQKLIAGGIENPRLEARVLLAEVLKKISLKFIQIQNLMSKNNNG